MSILSHIQQAVSTGVLAQPFRWRDVMNAIPAFNDGKTRSAYLSKHRDNNPGGYRRYFTRIGTGLYRLY